MTNKLSNRPLLYRGSLLLFLLCLSLGWLVFPAWATSFGPVSSYQDARMLSVSDIAFSDEVAVVIESGYLYLLDVSNPMTPDLIEDNLYIGQWWVDGGYGRAVAVADGYAYVAADDNGLRIYDISDPPNAYFVSSINVVDGEAVDVAIQDQTAYVALNLAGFMIVDVSDPHNPNLITHLDNAPSPYNGATAGAANSGIVAVDERLYLAQSLKGLTILDLSDPTNPLELGVFDTPDWARDVVISGTVAYVADMAGGVRIIDVTNPTNPTELSYILDNIPNARPWKLTLADNELYVGSVDDYLRILDVSDPANPILIESLDLLPADQAGDSNGLAVSAKGLVGVAYGSRGVHFVGRDGDEDGVYDHIEVSDTTPPTNPSFVDSEASSNIWTADVDPNFICNGASDDLSGVASYSLTFGNETITNSPTCAYDPLPLNQSGNYTLTVTTRDYADNLSVAEVGYIYRLDNEPPNWPNVVITESNGIISGTTQGVFSAPTFTWSPANDSHSGLAYYGLYFGSDPDGDPASTSLTTTTDIVFSPAVMTGTYYLRGQAVDQVGNASEAQTLFIFHYDPDFDSDNDGISDGTEGVIDSDNDTIPDFWDEDSDNDGTLDIDEGIGDNDGDGIANYVDADDLDGPASDLDADGLSNGFEDNVDSDGDGNPDFDVDGDGIPNRLDADSDDDGWPDVVEGAEDADDDGLSNFIDLDSDDDGLTDAQENELGTNPYHSDSDHDGLPDKWEVDHGLNPTVEEANDDADNDGLTNQEEYQLGLHPILPDSDEDGINDFVEVDDPASPVDTDQDGIIDALDEDSDNDGLLDQVEGMLDDDNDATPNFRDQDSDNDNLADADEGIIDTDGDGFPDYRDSDDDDDGLPTMLEDTNQDGDPRNDDADGDGTANYLDLDADNDGQPDIIEGTGDLDGDAIPNYLDADDTDGPAGDTDLDGIPNGVEDQAHPDADGDGVPNHLDTDSDSDGLTDEIEGTNDTDQDGLPDFLDADADGDGQPDQDEGMDDLDEDGLVNYLDSNDQDGPTGDLDDDGLTNLFEDSVDIDFDGISDLDVDQDGHDNKNDTDSDNDTLPDIIEGATDSDGDQIPNFVDLDSDGDGLTDQAEGLDDDDGDNIPNYLDNNHLDGPLADFDNDGIANAVEDQLGPDTDEDGLDNRVDPDSDGDGIPDAVELNGGSITQGTGLIVDALADVDGDGLPNLIDDDSDADGLSDAEEGTGDFDQDDIPDYLDPDPMRFYLFLPLMLRG